MLYPHVPNVCDAECSETCRLTRCAAQRQTNHATWGLGWIQLLSCAILPVQCHSPMARNHPVCQNIVLSCKSAASRASFKYRLNAHLIRPMISRKIFLPDRNFCWRSIRKSLLRLTDGGSDATFKTSSSERLFTSRGENILSKPRTICRSPTCAVTFATKVFCWSCNNVSLRILQDEI